MTIRGLKDLEYYRLCERDIVIFHVKDEYGEFIDLKYEVHSSFLMNITNIQDASPSDKYFNDVIFTMFGVDPRRFCSKSYGYEPVGGIWPCYKDFDFEAATNVVKALYALIDTMKIYNSSWAQNSTVEECKTQEPDLTPLKLKVQGTTSCSNPYQESLSDIPIDKLKKIASQIKTIKGDNNSKLKRI